MSQDQTPPVKRPKGRPRILPIPKRTKVSRACDLCKRHKRKCNGDNPCLYCQEKSLQCTYLKLDGRSKKSKIQSHNNNNGDLESVVVAKEIEPELPSLPNTPNSSYSGSGSLETQSHNGNNNNSTSSSSSSNTVNVNNDSSGFENNTNGNRRGSSLTADSSNNNSLPNNTNNNKPQTVDGEEKDSIAKTSLGMICQSLQTALSNDDNSNVISFFKKKQDQEARQERLSNLDGQHTRILTSETGVLRFFGESSALSLISECRALFYEVLGPSTFTNDPAQNFIHDELISFERNTTPDGINGDGDGKQITTTSNSGVAVQLPLKKDALIMIELFKSNINDTFYVFNMKYFIENIVDKVYNNPIIANSKQLCLLNFVFAIGSLFIEYSSDTNNNEIDYLPNSIEFLKSGQLYMRNNVYDGKLWMVEANFLKYFYYQACCNRSNSWINLGSAIRLAQALGMHRKIINDKIENQEISIHRRRLWRSLYVCDCVSSVNLGRPLMINTYDYDDINYPVEKLLLDENDNVERIRIIAQNATSDSAVLNRSIVQNLYNGGSINIKDSNSLALQLKLWSIELPNFLQLTSDMENQLRDPTNPNNYLFVFVHIGQLYGIMALTRPFLVHVVNRKLRPNMYKPQVTDEKQLMPFCKASIKAAFLTIKLFKFYCTFNKSRKEVFTIQSATFFALILLGFTLLEQINSKKPDHHYISVIKESIRDAISIFKLFNFNATCNRWAQHLIYMMEALNRPPAIIPSSLQQTTKTSTTTTTTTPVLSTHPITSTNLNYQQQQQQVPPPPPPPGSGNVKFPFQNKNNSSPSASSISSEIDRFNDELIRWNNDNTVFEQMVNFQQYFVPNDIDVLNNNYLDAFNYTNTYKYNM